MNPERADRLASRLHLRRRLRSIVARYPELLRPRPQARADRFVQQLEETQHDCEPREEGHDVD